MPPAPLKDASSKAAPAKDALSKDASGPPSAVIGLDEVESPAVRAGIAYWRGLARGRAFPSRRDISPAGMRGLLRAVVLIKVIESGADYEYRIVGDAHVAAYGFSLRDRRLSAMDEFAPAHAQALRRLYGRVLRKKEPFAIRGWAMSASGEINHLYNESVFLPLGPDDAIIDHILNFSTYTPRQYTA